MSARAVVFVPASHSDADFRLWLRICVEALVQAGAELVAVARRWPDVDALLESGEADVVVVARNDHVPERRIVIAGEMGEPSGDTRRPITQQRPDIAGPARQVTSDSKRITVGESGPITQRRPRAVA